MASTSTSRRRAAWTTQKSPGPTPSTVVQAHTTSAAWAAPDAASTEPTPRAATETTNSAVSRRPPGDLLDRDGPPGRPGEGSTGAGPPEPVDR